MGVQRAGHNLATEQQQHKMAVPETRTVATDYTQPNMLVYLMIKNALKMHYY